MVVSSHRSKSVESVPLPLGFLTTSEFVDELHGRLAGAQRSIAMQLMTFDGDRSGRAVARRLIEAAARGVSVRLVVDSFALRFVSDRPVSHPEVRAEFATTLDMYNELTRAGVELVFTNPNGPARIFTLARNHKKLYIIDDTVYLGGINVSDHNFAWHDFMVRSDDEAIRREALADFEATLAGRYTTIDQDLGDTTIVSNRAVEATFDRLVAGARRRVIIASPYALDRRLVESLEASSATERTVVMADHNNFRFLQAITPYLVDRASRAGVDLFTYGSFSHSKFLLADDQLLVGSSNFGRHSLTCNQEIGLVIRDRSFVAGFERAFLEGLQPVDEGATRPQRLFGSFATRGMERYLQAYARFVASRVPLLAGDRPRALRRAERRR